MSFGDVEKEIFRRLIAMKNEFGLCLQYELQMGNEECIKFCESLGVDICAMYKRNLDFANSDDDEIEPVCENFRIERKVNDKTYILDDRGGLTDPEYEWDEGDLPQRDGYVEIHIYDDNDYNYDEDMNDEDMDDEYGNDDLKLYPVAEHNVALIARALESQEDIEMIEVGFGKERLKRKENRYKREAYDALTEMYGQGMFVRTPEDRAYARIEEEAGDGMNEIVQEGTLHRSPPNAEGKEEVETVNQAKANKVLFTVGKSDEKPGPSKPSTARVHPTVAGDENIHERLYKKVNRGKFRPYLTSRNLIVSRKEAAQRFLDGMKGKECARYIRSVEFGIKTLIYVTGPLKAMQEFEREVVRHQGPIPPRQPTPENVALE